MKYNKTQNNSLWNKLLATFLTLVFTVVAFALPGIDATNLQTTPGVTVSGTASSLNIAAPNKSVLTWQHFGAGTNPINAGDRIEYVLPSANSSVLNIVAGGLSSTINGAIESNGKVFILNPNGILVGPTGTINVNGLYLSTVDDPVVASGYWATNGKLPSQDNLPTSVLTNGVYVSDGAIIQSIGNNITIASRNADIRGAILTGDLIVNTYGGNANLGSQGGSTTVLNGKTDINTSGGNITISPTGWITSTGNVSLNTSNALTSGNVTQGAGTLNATSLTVVGKDITLPRLTSTNVSVVGNNIVVNSVAGTVNYSGTSTGNLTLSGTNVNLNGLNNSGIGDTSVTGTSRVVLNGLGLGSTGNTTFTAPTVNDGADRLFVYGPTSFVSTGDVSVTRAFHSFGPVSLTVGGNATVTEDGTLNLNRVAVTGVLNAFSKNDIVQYIGTSRTVAGTANLNAVNVTLNDPTLLNSIGNVSLTTTGNSTLVQGRNTVLTGANVGGLLTVSTANTVGASVSQAAGSSLVAVTGLTVSTTNGTVDLTQINNRFGGVSINTGTGAISLYENATTNLLSLNGGTTLIASTGDIFNTSATTNSVVGTLSLTSGGKITLSPTLKTTALTFNAPGVTDLSALSFVANLSGVYPTNTGTGTFLPPKP